MTRPTSAERVADLVAEGEVQENARLREEIAELRRRLEDRDIEIHGLRQLLSESLTLLHGLTEKSRRIEGINVTLREELRRHAPAQIGHAA